MMFFGGGMLFFGLLVLVAIIVAVGGLGGFFNRERKGFNSASQQPAPRSSQDILRDRYARGEISHEEYQQMQATLEL